jgi:hypothetical protein
MVVPLCFRFVQHEGTLCLTLTQWRDGFVTKAKKHNVMVLARVVAAAVGFGGVCLLAGW